MLLLILKNHKWIKEISYLGIEHIQAASSTKFELQELDDKKIRSSASFFSDRMIIYFPQPLFRKF